MSKKQITNSSQRTVSKNNYTLLQTIDDDADDEVIVETAVNVKIPPITILKCKT